MNDARSNGSRPPGNHARDFDVLIIGAGPAGIAAACAASESGARVAIVDDNPAPGGQIWRGFARDGAANHAPSKAAAKWHERLQRANITRFFAATIVAQPQPKTLTAESLDGTFNLRYSKLVIAIGARERFLPCPGWTLPGVFGAGGLQALVKSGLKISGKRVVIAGSGPLLLAVAAYLKHAGAKILIIAEQTPSSKLNSFAAKLIAHPGKFFQAIALRANLLGIPYQSGTWPVAAGGNEKLEWVELSDGKSKRRFECDYLACGFHLVPNTELASLLGCSLQNGCVRVNESQQTSVEGIYCAGEPCGIGGLECALAEGEIAGFATGGNARRAQSLFAQRTSARRFAAALEEAFALREELRNLAAPDTFICRCEDVTRERIAQHSSWRDAKLQTRCGMGPCQGRVCGPAIEFIFGWTPESVRPPIFPARVASLMISEESSAFRRVAQSSEEQK
jgi:D-hydroxyproline dehydrogenase subunit alpha